MPEIEKLVKDFKEEVRAKAIDEIWKEKQGNEDDDRE